MSPARNIARFVAFGAVLNASATSGFASVFADQFTDRCVARFVAGQPASLDGMEVMHTGGHAIVIDGATMTVLAGSDQTVCVFHAANRIPADDVSQLSTSSAEWLKDASKIEEEISDLAALSSSNVGTTEIAACLASKPDDDATKLLVNRSFALSGDQDGNRVFVAVSLTERRVSYVDQSAGVDLTLSAWATSGAPKCLEN